jgi:CRISPR/Cas system-associated exonuclease Cas4 (RecB family)
MSTLDATFQFSQHSLSDFRDCARRFYLRYIAKQAWPTLEVAPFGMDALEYRDYLRKGALLHQWIERHLLGMQAPQLPDDDELALWWMRYANTDLSALPPTRDPELALVAPLGPYRLYARFDLLAVDEAAGGAVIVDWKTLRGDRAPAASFLRDRIQTRAYLYVLATAGAPFNGGQLIPPEQIRMRYWLANFPEQPWVEITYSRREYEADTRMLLALADDAATRPDEAAYPMTDDERKCSACLYRTLCKRSGGPVTTEALLSGEDDFRDEAATPIDY